MSEPNDPKIDLKYLKLAIQKEKLDRLANEQASEIKDLKAKLKTSEKKASSFQKMYFKAARLGERIIPPEGLDKN